MQNSVLQASTLRDVDLSDKFTKNGRVLISGTQALVRMTMMQRELDERAGLNTGCFISGYRGSPLGSLDLQLQRSAEMLEEENIRFVPGINEELAATAVWGSQQVGLHNDSGLDGVFGLWYGKGPGVDRTGDAFRHANLSGTSRHGGVLALLGDDHTCESSTTCHQSEFAMVDSMIPTLNPAGIREIVEYGLHGWAMSRFSGCWTAIKCVHDTVSSTASIDLSIDDFVSIKPDTDVASASDLNIKLGDTPRDQERRLVEHKLAAVQSYVHANSMDKRVVGNASAKLGIVTTGKSYLDVCQSLSDLGIDEARAEALGLTVYKVALVWPMEPLRAKEICADLDHILVVEEKRELIETQLKTMFYNMDSSPKIIGKTDAKQKPLLRSILDLDSNMVAKAIAHLILNHTTAPDIEGKLQSLESIAEQSVVAGPLSRTPYFCAGCPHSSSTHLPAGSRGMAGIGCAWMSQFMERGVEGYTQMGGEGATWIGEAPFSKTEHIFQNLGDGTYFHSGHLAIRAAVASGANITYKVLFNDAVAMTGGQMHDGTLTPWGISAQVHAEGVNAIAVVTDEPDKYPSTITWAPSVTIHHRRDLDQVQMRLRDTPGTTVLIYDQTCAAEKRRRRKRKTYPDPPKRIFINSDVCEGCGDCGLASNCTAILPKETELGRKREIDQSSCNKDYSCVQGFCPSFVTVLDGNPRKPEAISFEKVKLEDPDLANLDNGFNIVVTGVGGTGVVTVGAILAMAAHLENKGCAILDMTGLAQKGGAVVSHLRLSNSPEDIGTIRIAPGGADLILGFDSVVSSSHEALELIASGETSVVLNTNQIMPGEFTRKADLKFPQNEILKTLQTRAGAERVETIDATRIATKWLGNSIAANLLMTGFAFQRGLIPLSGGAIERAIEINGAAVSMNKTAFELGRQIATLDGEVPGENSPTEDSLKFDSDDVSLILNHRYELLTQYQSVTYADRYKDLVEKVTTADAAFGNTCLSVSVAKYYYKVLAYKDEYEVARLFSSSKFTESLKDNFSGEFKLKFNLAPPLLSPKDKSTGHLRKVELGGWVLHAFKLLAKFKFLRGTVFDLFGFSAERKEEREHVVEYEKMIAHILLDLSNENYEMAVELADLPEHVRGYGHIKSASLEQMRIERAGLLRKFEGSVDDAKPSQFKLNVLKST